jgi:alpha-L-fucosidase
MFAADLASKASSRFRPTGGRSALLEVDFPRAVTFNVARLAEDITIGQRVARYTVSVLGGAASRWQEVSRGTTIGYAKIDRFPAATTRRVRVTIEDTVDLPLPIRLSLFMSS